MLQTFGTGKNRVQGGVGAFPTFVSSGTLCDRGWHVLRSTIGRAATRSHGLAQFRPRMARASYSHHHVLGKAPRRETGSARRPVTARAPAVIFTALRAASVEASRMPSAFVSLVLVVLCAAAYMHFSQPSVQSIIDRKVSESGGPQAVDSLDLVSAERGSCEPQDNNH